MCVRGCAVLALLVLSAASPMAFADDLRIAAWNLEHLDDTDGDGCVGRKPGVYAALARRIGELDAAIFAFQEVENAAAARRVFPASEWRIEMSRRPSRGPGRTCWHTPDARLGHLATGFAVRHGIAYRRNPDLQALGSSDSFQRWAADITVTAGERDLRLLSVHLRTGCWGAGQDGDSRAREACATVRGQIEHLGDWADTRRTQGTAFVILGDFNRRLTLAGDWAWRRLSSPASPLRLLTRGVPFRCDPRYPAFIDHMVLGGGAEAMAVPGSFREVPAQGPHPDHCAITAVFRLGHSKHD